MCRNKEDRREGEGRRRDEIDVYKECEKTGRGLYQRK